jgi:hypothetical protein
MELVDVADLLKNVEFAVFLARPTIRKAVLPRCAFLAAPL